MRNVIAASVVAVCGAAVVLYAIALGTDESGRYGTVQTIALAAGFLAFVVGARHVIETFRGAEA